MEISIKNAKEKKLFYVVVTGVIYNPRNKKCLILKRSKKEVAHPGLWGVTGGKLEWQDLQNNPPSRQNFDIKDWEGLIERLLQREAKEESGLDVYDPRYLDSVVFLRPDNIPVVCFKFALKYKKGRVKIPEEFEDFAWVDSKEVRSYRCIQGIDKEVANTIKLYSPSPY
jgi:ADP-ribose pyrophosphatase YjhB (NUDIX family)